MNAAILLAQLEKRVEIQKLRHEVWQKYYTGLSDWCRSRDVSLPTVPDDCQHSAHMFYIVTPNLEFRSRLITHLKTNGVGSAFHYQALHLSDMGRRYGGREGDCPVTERVSDCLLRLPLWNQLTPAMTDQVIKAVKSF